MCEYVADQVSDAPKLTHFVNGLPHMVDVTGKVPSHREAQAEAWVILPAEARAALESGSNKKGDPLMVARLAGLAGSKRTADLITLCHPIPITSAKVEVSLQPRGVHIVATIKTEAVTGVEMEALSAVTVAALNVYDMLKAASKAIEIQDVRLIAKSGGKSGDYLRHES